MDLRPTTACAGLVAALVTAAALQAMLVARAGTVSADSITFIAIARELPQAPLETIRKQDQHPGFPAAVLAATQLARSLGWRGEPESWIIGGRIITFTCGLLSVWVVWLLGRDLFGVQAANLGALAFAVLPIPRFNAADAQSDTSHLLFYLLAAWLVMTGLEGPRWRRLAGGGLASGIAYWIRPEGFEVALAGLACLVACGFYAHWGFRRLSLASAALAGTALAVVIPYCLLAGKFTSKQVPLQAPSLHVSQVDSAEADVKGTSPPASTHAPAAESRYSLSRAVRLLPKALSAYINSICQGFKFVFLPLYLIGMVVLFRRRPDWPPIIFLAGLGALHTLVLLSVFVLSGYIAHRHVLPLVGLAMPFAALGVVSSGRWLARRTGVRASYGVATVMACASAFALASTLRPFNREFLPVIEATRWVEAHGEPGAGIVCNSPYVSFYGARPTAYLGPQSPTLDEALAKAAVPARYDYVILHVGAHAYQPEWIAQIEQRYHQVKELPDPYCLPTRPRKVLLFESKHLQAQRASMGPHS